MTLDIVLVGFGRVARRFATLLTERRSLLARDYDCSARIVGATTMSHGSVWANKGLNASALRALIAAAGRGEAIGDQLLGTTTDFVTEAVARHTAAARQGRLVIVETTTLDVELGEPAASHIRTALEGGAHVITANKGPIACAYKTLARVAARADRRLLFEGTVMDGVPLFNLVRETLPAVRIAGFRGVVNSTTNFILTAMEQGQPFAEALAEMQAMGVAEADASLDVDGWDAAAKTAALANVLMGAALTPRDVERRGITPATRQQAVDARAAGRRLKLVARAGVVDGCVTASVTPEELAEDDLLASLEGRQNAIILHTDLLEEIAIVQRSGSLTQTAYALLSDLVTIARGGEPPARSRGRGR